ncbi:MAG: PAS domain-containing protein [Desulfovibrionaceae bacterium]|nr:PAS domain-containing protein [Desulfovibrionaceae bacterium]
MKNALELLKDFCTFDFVERDSEKALSILTEDICWFGTSDHEDVHGLAEAHAYVHDEIERLPTPYQISVFDETYVPISKDSGVAFIKMNMENEGVSVALRATAASRMEDGVLKLCTMHFSVADEAQQPDEYYPLAKGREKIAREKRELVFSTMSGGMMGCYLKSGFPLYFIDERLLHYLGYATEAEFSSDIDGFVSNSIHPDDRLSVEEAIERQLLTSNQYTVDYRMRKQNGSYIWVHDIGRKTMSENGKDIVLSVCYDITEEHQKQVQLDNLVNSMPGGVALYQLENDDCKVLYQSQGLAKIVGMTQEEYKNQVESRVTSAIYEGDTDKVLQALDKVSKSDETVSVDFRVVHVSGHTVWINGSYKRAATKNGCPIIHAVFSEMPQMRELLGNVVENSGVAIIVTDDNTRELLYANHEALSIYKKTDSHYEGQCCYKYLLGQDKPCDFCRNQRGESFENQSREVYEPLSGRYFMTQGRIINWAGRNAHIEYLTDITEAKKTQQQLAEMSSEMQTIVDNIPGGVVKMRVGDDSIVPIYISDQFCEMVGDTQERLMSVYQSNAMAGVHPDDYERVLNIVAEGMHSGESFNATYRICNSRGEYFWVNTRASRVVDQSNQVFYYAIYTNIDKEIKAKQAAEQATREMELLYNTIPGAVFKCRFNADWDVIFANDGLFRFLGYTREEFNTLFHNKMSGVIYPEDGAIMADKILAQLKNNTTVHNENRLICKDGSIKWISIHAELLIDDAAEKYFYCTFVDITEQKKAELALSQTQEKLSAAISHAGLAYWEYDIQNNKAYLNDVSTTEYKLATILENYPQSIYDSGVIALESIEQYQRLIDAVKAGKTTVSADIKTVDISGETVWKRVRFTTLVDEKNRPFWAVATAETIDELKSLEQQLAITAVQTGIEAWIYDIGNHTITRTTTTGMNYGLTSIIPNVPESLLQMGTIYKDDAPAVYEMYRKLHSGEKTVSAKMRIFLPEIGEYAYHKVHYTVIFDKGGKPTKAIGTGVNISKQIELEKQYLEALETYRNVPKENILLSGYCSITHNQLVGMTSWDNVNYLAQYKNDRDAFFINLSTIVDGEEQKQELLDKFLVEPLIRAYAKGIARQSLQCTILVDKSYFRYVEMTIDVLKKPGTEELTGFFNMTDMTDEIIYKKAVTVGLQKYSDFMVDVDIRQDVFTMISSRYDLVDIPPQSGVFSIANKQHASKLADESSTRECMEKLSYPYMLESLKSKDSYWFYYRIFEGEQLHTKKIQVFYIDKQLEHIGFVRTDVTEMLAEEQKKNEALAHALTSSERANKAKAEFLSRMSHDIRTPMNAIIGMTELSKKEIDDKQRVLENIEVIDSSSKLLLRIINNVLDMSQIESGTMVMATEPFDCDTECKDVVDMTAAVLAKKQQKLVVKNNITHRYVVGDVVRLKRVLLNLLNNASKFSPNNSEIRLEACEESNQNPQYITLIFSVSDSGIGIPKDKLEIIFQPFKQLETDEKYLGSGLGLPIVKSIVESKGGTVCVDSEVGKGSTFTVRVPMRLGKENQAAGFQHPAKTVEDSAADVDFSDLRVLLVEDHPVNTVVAKRLLEKFGATIDTAANGAIAYDKFVQSEKNTYNIIFMDIQMPVMNGYEAAKAIRQSVHPQAKTIPILAMTANAFTQDIQNSLDSGMNGHIAKPITIDAIAKAVRDASKLK